MTEQFDSYKGIGPTVSLQLNNTRPQMSCEIDFLKRVGEHAKDEATQCNAQVLFLRRAATEIEAAIDRRIETVQSHDDVIEIALLEMQAMSYRVKSRMVGETCMPKDIAGDMQEIFALPIQTS